MKKLNLVTFLGVIFSLAQARSARQFNGTLSSPNYPLNYPNNKIVSHVLNVPPTSEGLIQLCFGDFETESKYDTLTVYDFQTNVFTMLYQFSGSGPRIKCLPTQSRKVMLSFRSDMSVTKRGYTLEYSLIPNNDTGIPSPIGQLTNSNLTKATYVDLVAPSHVDGFIQLYLGASPLELFFWKLIIIDVQNTTSYSTAQIVLLDKARSFPKYIYSRSRHLTLIPYSRGQFPVDSSTNRSQIRLPWGLYSTLNDTEMLSRNKELRIKFFQRSQAVLMGQNPYGQAQWVFFLNSKLPDQRFSEEVIQTDRRYASLSGCIRISFLFSWLTSGVGGLQLVYQSPSIPNLWQAAWQSKGTGRSVRTSVKIFSHDVTIAFRGTWGGKYRVDDVSISECSYLSVTTPQSTPSPNTLVYRGTQGTVISPGYPTGYPPNVDARWRIISYESITLVFQVFDTERTYDRLKVYDYRGSSRLVFLRTFSGSIRPGYTFQTYRRIIELHFSSDSSRQQAGFIIKWQRPRSEVTTVQHVTVRPERGVVVSPGYPYYFPSSSYATWDIKKYSNIYLLFEEFDTERDFQELTVYEISKTGQNRIFINELLKTFTGYLTPNTCYATGRDHIRLSFTAFPTSKRNRRGFKIRYTTEKPSTCEDVELNVLQITGITLGVLGLMLILCSGLFMVHRRRKPRSANLASANAENTGGNVSLANLVTVSNVVHQGEDGPYSDYHYREDYTAGGPPSYSEIYQYRSVQSVDPPAYERVAGVLQDDARNKPEEIVPSPPANDNVALTSTTDSRFCGASDIMATESTGGPRQGESGSWAVDQESPNESNI